MAKTWEKHTFTLRFLIDEEKNRVVLSEAGKDFVEVLCGLLTLPMGTIVRLLEKHKNPQSSIIGCFHNLHRSLSIMDDDNFQTPGCKNLLLHPKSMKEAQRRRLKLNIEDDAAEKTKFFVCPHFMYDESCCKAYSNVRTSTCSCGRTMGHYIHVEEGEEADGCLGNNEGDGVFFSCRTSFIITDDMEVALNSMGLVLNILNDRGYSGFDKLREMVLDVGFEEVMTLLSYLFTSEGPLTDTFLRKHCVMTRKRKVLTPVVQETRVDGEVECLTLKVFIRKLDREILYAECREDFVDFLFSFLAIPLEFAWELSIDDANLGCVGNLCRSVKELSFEKQKEAKISKCVLPHCYSFRAQLLDVVIQEKPEYECLFSRHGYTDNTLRKEIKKTVLGDALKIVKVAPVYASVGHVKGETNFIVSDDLVVTPMNSSSTISLLSKLQLSIGDIEEHVVSIGKDEATSILRASLVTTSALTNGLSNFLSNKMTPQEAKQPTKKDRKV